MGLPKSVLALRFALFHIAATHMSPGRNGRMVVNSLQLLSGYNSSKQDGLALLPVLKPVQHLLEDGVRVWVCITDKEQDKAHVRALEGVLQLLGATDTEIVLKGPTCISNSLNSLASDMPELLLGGMSDKLTSHMVRVHAVTHALTDGTHFSVSDIVKQQWSALPNNLNQRHVAEAFWTAAHELHQAPGRYTPAAAAADSSEEQQEKQGQVEGRRHAGTKRIYSLANPASVALARDRASDLAAAGAVLSGLMRNPLSFKKRPAPEADAAAGQMGNSQGSMLAAPAHAAAGGAHAAAGVGAGAGAAGAGPAGRKWWQKQATDLPAPAPAAGTITTATPATTAAAVPQVAAAQPSAPAAGVMGKAALPEGIAPASAVSSAPHHQHLQQHAACNAVAVAVAPAAFLAGPVALQVPIGAASNLRQVQLAQQQQSLGTLQMQAAAAVLQRQVVAAQVQAALLMRAAVLRQLVAQQQAPQQQVAQQQAIQQQVALQQAVQQQVVQQQAAAAQNQQQDAQGDAGAGSTGGVFVKPERS